jgi:hypothetical protein
VSDKTERTRVSVRFSFTVGSGVNQRFKERILALVRDWAEPHLNADEFAVSIEDRSAPVYCPRANCGAPLRFISGDLYRCDACAEGAIGGYVYWSQALTQLPRDSSASPESQT